MNNIQNLQGVAATSYQREEWAREDLADARKNLWNALETGKGVSGAAHAYREATEGYERSKAACRHADAELNKAKAKDPASHLEEIDIAMRLLRRRVNALRGLVVPTTVPTDILLNDDHVPVDPEFLATFGVKE